MIQISKQEYMNAFLKDAGRYSDNIDVTQYSDFYYSIGDKAYAGLHFQKGGIVQVNGLFSSEQGFGEKLLNNIIEKYEKEHTAIRLNCTKILRDNYYTKKWGFQEILRITHKDYYELVLFLGW